MKRILHFTAVRELGSGQRKQLIYENKAAKQLIDIQWDVIAYHSFEPQESFEKQTPRLFDFLIIRNLYFWIQVFKLSKYYDVILFRYISFDPFAVIFSPFIKNRISVHHSKEIEELPLVRKGWKGMLASWLEKYTGKVALKNSLAIVGVTEEIALYEKGRIVQNKKTYVYPNGLDFSLFPIVDDKRDPGEYHILFMCSYFSEWHGLDLLINEIDKTKTNVKFYIHLIGNLASEQFEMIKHSTYSDSIIIHGQLDRESYIKIAEKCDVGLASLALHRQNLKEASTLKVREMLAMGLPVFSCHKDVAFNNDFPFYKYKEEFNFEDILEFCMSHKSTSRLQVKETAKLKINKVNIMNDFIQKISC